MKTKLITFLTCLLFAAAVKANPIGIIINGDTIKGIPTRDTTISLKITDTALSFSFYGADTIRLQTGVSVYADYYYSTIPFVFKQYDSIDTLIWYSRQYIPTLYVDLLTNGVYMEQLIIRITFI